MTRWQALLHNARLSKTLIKLNGIKGTIDYINWWGPHPSGSNSSWEIKRLETWKQRKPHLFNKKK